LIEVDGPIQRSSWVEVVYGYRLHDAAAAAANVCVGAQERWKGQFQTSLSRILFCPIFSKILYAISSTGIVAIMSVVVVVIT
jgi:hypothetical protein